MLWKMQHLSIYWIIWFLLISQWLLEISSDCILHKNTKEVRKYVIREMYEGYQYVSYNQPITEEVLIDTSATCTEETLTPNINLFPLENPYNLQSIVFETSNLTLVPLGVFDTFINLTSLYLNNSQVQNILPGAFTRLLSLKKLHLDNNYMTKVSRGILNSLSGLKMLDLQNNKITEIEEHAFTGLNSLEYLYINNNELEFISPSIFDQLKALQEINFSYNHLQNFKINPIPSLVRCDVSFNLLESIDLSSFTSSLSDLKLSTNQISSIIWNTDNAIKKIQLGDNNLTSIFNVGGSATDLDISGNKIIQLNGSLFEEADQLVTLNLHHNFINNLTVEFSKSLVALQYLYLQHNYITTIPVGYFRNLKALLVLDLSYNQLTEIDYGTFIGIEALESLDLSNNELTHLYESALHRMSNLTKIFLQNNHLRLLDPHELKINLNSLTYIQLEENEWTCKFLSKTLTDFKDLGVVVARGSVETTSNFHGIGCTLDRSLQNKAVSDQKYVKDHVQSIDRGEVLKQYFDEGFFSSNFYKYLEKWKDVIEKQNWSTNLVNFSDPELRNSITNLVVSPLKMELEELNKNSVSDYASSFTRYKPTYEESSELKSSRVESKQSYQSGNDTTTIVCMVIMVVVLIGVFVLLSLMYLNLRGYRRQIAMRTGFEIRDNEAQIELM